MKKGRDMEGREGNLQVNLSGSIGHACLEKLKTQIYPTRIVNEDGKACCQLWTGARSGTHLNKRSHDEKQKSSNLKNADASSKLGNDLKHKRGYSSSCPVMPPSVIKDSFVPKESDSHSTSLHGSPASVGFLSTRTRGHPCRVECVPFSERPLKVN